MDMVGLGMSYHCKRKMRSAFLRILCMGPWNQVTMCMTLFGEWTCWRCLHHLQEKNEKNGLTGVVSQSYETKRNLYFLETAG